MQIHDRPRGTLSTRYQRESQLTLSQHFKERLPWLGKYLQTRSLWAQLLVGGTLGLLDFVLCTLQALRSCDPRKDALDSDKSKKKSPRNTKETREIQTNHQEIQKLSLRNPIFFRNQKKYWVTQTNVWEIPKISQTNSKLSPTNPNNFTKKSTQCHRQNTQIHQKIKRISPINPEKYKKHCQRHNGV